jgi:hypothetical protein
MPSCVQNLGLTDGEAYREAAPFSVRRKAESNPGLDHNLAQLLVPTTNHSPLPKIEQP